MRIQTLKYCSDLGVFFFFWPACGFSFLKMKEYIFIMLVKVNFLATVYYLCCRNASVAKKQNTSHCSVELLFLPPKSPMVYWHSNFMDTLSCPESSFFDDK